MLPKPSHLGPHYGAQFKDPSIVAAYPSRPPYPSEMFGRLAALIAAAPRTVLDVGCGTGELARGLVRLIDRVDAVDWSSGMIEQGKRLPEGGHPNLNWIHDSVEQALLTPPYALITAGESLHWLAWDIVFPRFVDVLLPEGLLAVVGRWWDTKALRERLAPIIQRYSTNREFQSYDLLGELQSRKLFEKRGEYFSQPEPWRPTIAEYLECRHSQNGLSRDRMGPEAAAFDEAVEMALWDLCRLGELEVREDRLELTVQAGIVWGKPLWPYT